MGNRQGCRMWTVEVAEWNRSVSLCRVKTWPQLTVRDKTFQMFVEVGLFLE